MCLLDIQTTLSYIWLTFPLLGGPDRLIFHYQGSGQDWTSRGQGKPLHHDGRRTDSRRSAQNRETNIIKNLRWAVERLKWRTQCSPLNHSGYAGMPITRRVRGFITGLISYRLDNSKMTQTVTIFNFYIYLLFYILIRFKGLKFQCDAFQIIMKNLGGKYAKLHNSYMYMLKQDFLVIIKILFLQWIGSKNRKAHILRPELLTLVIDWLIVCCFAFRSRIYFNNIKTWRAAELRPKMGVCSL